MDIMHYFNYLFIVFIHTQLLNVFSLMHYFPADVNAPVIKDKKTTLHKLELDFCFLTCRS